MSRWDDALERFIERLMGVTVVALLVTFLLLLAVVVLGLGQELLK